METQHIDLVAIDEAKNQVNLIIMDDERWEDARKHIDKIHEKILSYVAFVENGTYNKKYPKLVSREVLIKVVFEHIPTEEGQTFVNQIQDVLGDIGYQLEFVNYASL